MHIDLAIELLKAILSTRESYHFRQQANRTGESRKTLVSFLSKLYLPETEDVEDWKTKSLIILINAIKNVSIGKTKTVAKNQKRPFAEAASRNALLRFETSVSKRYSSQLEGFDEDTFRGDGREQVTELFGFVDDV